MSERSRANLVRTAEPDTDAIVERAVTPPIDASPHTDASWPLRLVVFAAIAAPAVALRVWRLDALGINSDEAVYAGQAASLAGNDELLPYFPVFRAHPLLFQSLLSIAFRGDVSTFVGRMFAVGFGLGTVAVTYLLGKHLYGRKAGAVAALLLAVMPYHVIVSRQILLDGPMVFWATVTLYLLARYASSERFAWLGAAGGALGLTVLSKETSIVLLGAFYAFFTLASEVRTRWRHMAGAAATFAAVGVVHPLAVKITGASSTGEKFLVWQLFRRPNHTWTFYAETLPTAIGILTILAAVIGLVLLRDHRSWRETLLVAWIVVPFLFFQVWPVKGYQYLLPTAPAIALLAGRTLAALPGRAMHVGRWTLRSAQISLIVIALVAASSAAASWDRIQPSNAGSTFLAGTGGVPGGREAGQWVGENIPEGARLLALGPSMANIIQFYGHRKTFGLSVSPNPLHRNPVYEPIHNPDLWIRNNELQYLVWDSYSASRSPFFSQRLLRFAERYHGRIVHQETVDVVGPGGVEQARPVIVIYEVRP